VRTNWVKGLQSALSVWWLDIDSENIGIRFAKSHIGVSPVILQDLTPWPRDPMVFTYNASKFAPEGLADALRLELYDTHIHISLIEPGPILSDFRKISYALYKKYRFHAQFS
jgi:NAD(P)-dependent dehydrogenase (short-subunit alcohol dehydrogenase family)